MTYRLRRVGGTLLLRQCEKKNVIIIILLTSYQLLSNRYLKRNIFIIRLADRWVLCIVIMLYEGQLPPRGFHVLTPQSCVMLFGTRIIRRSIVNIYSGTNRLSIAEVLKLFQSRWKLKIQCGALNFISQFYTYYSVNKTTK